MIETTEYQDNIIEIICAARVLNSQIGSYLKHYLNENFNYTVLLCNKGTVIIPRDFAQGGIDSMIREELELVARSFRTLE